MTFGQKLSTLRRELTLTQKELAKKLNVSRQAITKWENDTGVPDIDNVLKISTFFNIPVEELLDYKIEGVCLPTQIEEEIDRENSKLKNVESFVVHRFQDAEEIYFLSRERKLNAWEWLLDFFIGAGTLDMADIAKTGLVYCFLVKEKERYKLLLLRKEKMVVKTLGTPFAEKKAVIDGYRYHKTKRLK